MKFLLTLSRVIIGLVFMFSGIVKAIDPLGFAYKFHDYFMAFNLGFLDKFSLPLAIIMCSAEFIAGFSVLTGYRQKTGIWAVMILMVIFTPLTLVLALTNPVSDCGCFGDAIHLTNWQTFAKNLILIAFAILLFIKRKNIKEIYDRFTEWSIISASIVILIFFIFFNLRYLPVIDFLPYKKGVTIADQMVIPEGVPVDIYETTFIYEKDGLRKEFTINDYPAEDTTWQFVDQKSILIKKGYQPPIHDFVITSQSGDDITDKILSDPGYSLLMIVKKLPEADFKRLSEGFSLGKFCNENGINFYILTASGASDINKYANGLNFCTVDETTLKTIIRATPGYVLLKSGVILEKWSWANIPEKEWFSTKTFNSTLQ